MTEQDAFFDYFKQEQQKKKINYGHHEDYYKDFYIKQLLHEREVLKELPGNPVTLRKIKELEELLYEQWLIVIPEDKQLKQQEFNFN